MKSPSAWFIVVVGLFLMPMAAGAPAMSVDLGTALSDGFRAFWSLFDSEYVVFGVTVIVLIVLFRNIFMAGLSKVPGLGETRYAATISTMLSLLAVLGIVFLKIQKGYSVNGVLEDILGPAGIYAVLFVTVMFYLWLRHSIGSKRVALAVAGLIGYTLGSMIANELMMTIGVFTFLAGVLAYLIGRRGNDYSDYSGNTPKAPSVGLSRMFGGRKEKVKAKDSVTLIKDQLKALDREEKLSDQMRRTDDHVAQLEGMRQRLESEEKIDIEQEQGILKELGVVYENVREIDKSLQDEERYYARTGNQEALRKITYLKNRREQFSTLYRQLMQKLDIVANDEQRILKDKEKIEELEKRDLDSEIGEAQDEVRSVDQVKEDEKELEDDIPKTMIQRELQEENIEVDGERTAEALEKTLETEQSILKEREKYEKELDRLQSLLMKDRSPQNVQGMSKFLQVYGDKMRELDMKMAELQKRDRALQERTNKDIKLLETSKKADVVYEKQEAR